MIRPDEIDRGPPANRAVVFLHGFLGEPADWEALLSGWNPQRRVLALCLPGHGAPPVPLPASLPGGVEPLLAAAQGLQERVRALGVAHVDLVGYSLGGRLGLAWSLLPESLVRRGAYIGASAGIEDPAQRAARRKLDGQRAEQLRSGGIKAFLQQWYAQDLFGPLSRSDAFPTLLARRARGDATALAAALEAFGPGRQSPLGQRLAASPSPALLVAGALDSKYATSNAALARCRAGIQAVTIPFAGHSPHLETPDALREILEEFFEAEEQDAAQEARAR